MILSPRAGSDPGWVACRDSSPVYGSRQIVSSTTHSCSFIIKHLSVWFDKLRHLMGHLFSAQKWLRQGWVFYPYSTQIGTRSYSPYGHCKVIFFKPRYYTIPYSANSSVLSNNFFSSLQIYRKKRRKKITKKLECHGNNFAILSAMQQPA